MFTSFHASEHALHQSVTLLLGDFMMLLAQKFKQLGFVWWLVTIILFNTLQRFSKRFRSGDWTGHDGPPSSPWLTCVAWSIVLEEPILRVGERYQIRKQVFFQDDLVHCFIHAPFTKPNVPDSSLAEAPPDHHQSCTKLNSSCKIPRCVGLSRSPSKH